MAYDIYQIANKMLVMASQQEDPLTNMKLQKLMYYQQGFHIAYFKGEPLFDEDIEAWMYGPVVPSLYEHYAACGNQVIEPNSSEITILSEREEALFNEVFRVYSVFSAYKLKDMTHSESPWKTTPIGKGNVIGKDKLLSYFRTRIKK